MRFDGRFLWKKKAIAAGCVLGLAFASACGSGEVETMAGGSEPSSLSPSSQTLSLTAQSPTLLKAKAVQSSQLGEQQKCAISRNTHLKGKLLGKQNGHILVELRDNRPIVENCRFTRGYLFAKDFGVDVNTLVIPASSSRGPLAAMLSVIGFAEGTHDRYDLIYSFQTFSSFHDHPRRVICASGICSSAAGRYQFLDTTWDLTRQAVGLPDFTPRSQDRGAVYLIESVRGVRNAQQRLSRSQFERAVYKLNREWASLPGSPYGQPTKSMSALWAHYSSRL